MAHPSDVLLLDHPNIVAWQLVERNFDFVIRSTDLGTEAQQTQIRVVEQCCTIDTCSSSRDGQRHSHQSADPLLFGSRWGSRSESLPRVQRLRQRVKVINW